MDWSGSQGYEDHDSDDMFLPTEMTDEERLSAEKAEAKPGIRLYMDNHVADVNQQVSEPALRKADLSWSLDSARAANIALKYAINAECVLCAVSFNHSGSLLAFSTLKTLYLVKSEGGTVSASIDLPTCSTLDVVYTRTLVFSYDDSYIALNGPDNTVNVWWLRDKKGLVVLRGHTGKVSSLAVSKDGKHLMSGGFDGTLCVWDAARLELKRKLSFGDERKTKADMIVAIDVSSDGSVVLIGFMDGSVRLYNGALEKEIAVFSAHERGLLSVTSCPQTQTFATTSYDMTAKVWSLGERTAECVKVLSGHMDFVITGRFCNCCNNILLTGGKDEAIKAWNVENGDIVFTLNGHKNTLFHIDHHPTEKTFVSCGGDGLVCVWDYQNIT